ncbi:MAG: metal ABC transporter solute-binding protein, Zn/Mn family, partial [Halobacteriota archaeon]
LEARYGFRLHSPVGVSPQNEPSQSEIADTIELVNTEGIDTILYDRFESTTLAETIVENSDATETTAVSPAGGTTEEWNDAGYGYLEQMTEINVPAFERAFGVQ